MIKIANFSSSISLHKYEKVKEFLQNADNQENLYTRLAELNLRLFYAFSLGFRLIALII